jgi:hypothetical protein
LADQVQQSISGECHPLFPVNEPYKIKQEFGDCFEFLHSFGTKQRSIGAKHFKILLKKHPIVHMPDVACNFVPSSD